jgi:hypothetical protein
VKLPPGYRQPRNISNMIGNGTTRDGEPDQTDLMAVVSMDGIGMGRNLIAWLETLCRSVADEDARFKAELRDISESLKRRWHEAWKDALWELVRQFPEKSHNAPSYTLRSGLRELTLKSDGKGGRWLPCRRIYQGGDDLTFVCDARIALSLADFLARRVEQRDPISLGFQNVPTEFKRVPVSVGIVFVDSHFPFVRAVQMAAAVQKPAKRKAADWKMHDEDGLPPSVIDWWVNRPGALERSKGEKTIKPYPVYRKVSGTELTLEDLRERILPEMEATFFDARNKLKDILAAAEEGPDRVRRVLEMRPLPDGRSLRWLEPGFDPNTGFPKGEGSGATRTPLLDAGEIYDVDLPFVPQQKETAA